MEDLHEETGIHQVQNCVFNAADVLVYIHPVVGLLRVPGLFIVAGIGIAQEIPGRADEGIHRIGFSRRRATAFRAGAVNEFFARRQGRYGAGRKLDIRRQFNRQLIFRHELFAAFRAVNDRNRRAPIALTGNEPVAELEVDRALAEVVIDEPFRNGLAAFFVSQAVEFAGVNQNARVVVSPFHRIQIEAHVFILYN